MLGVSSTNLSCSSTDAGPYIRPGMTSDILPVQGSMLSLAQECNSPDSRGSSSQYIGSPMRSDPVCRICDEAVC